MRSTHRLFAAGIAMGTALVAGYPLLAIPGGALAAVTAAGRSSPDADASRAWRAFDDAVPDEWLGAGGPLQHRGIMHWWGLPAAAQWALWPYVHRVPAPLDAIVGFVFAALLIGWWSHLLGDFLFGRAGYGRAAGIPLGPWHWHVGLGLDVGGWLEVVVRVALATACSWLAWESVEQCRVLLRR
jgi:hypothetical protein